MSSPIRFPEELPITAHVREIAAAIDASQVVVIAGETGSGKTTQLPKICLAMGRGLEAHIGVTQPRRIAATSVAARVASELGVQLGREVGYQIRFANKTSAATYVKFMTDGILLAEIQGDPLLRAYDTIILDEAHERSLDIDFLLGYLKRLLPRRPDLRVIVSSATLEVDRFAAFFDGAPVIQVSGRTYPVDVVYRPPTRDEGDLAETVAAAVDELTELDPREDVLVFLPGEREIREATAALTARALPHTVILPLYGRLAQADQARVFTQLPERRVVLATNVAETSLTIPGIVYVVDTGLARVNRNDARSGVTRLLVEPISRASADQRKGRAGRTRHGVCIRLFEEQDFALRPAFTDPEVLRVGLAGAILRMKALGLGALESFPFLDPPPKRAVDEGYRVLVELGALDPNATDGPLTDIGKKLARLPVDPRIGRMILGGEQEGALREVTILAAALGLQDPRERPLSAQREADQAHRRFRDEASDFAGLLALWSHFQAEQGKRTQNQLRKWCKDGFLSYNRMREWIDVHAQLARTVRELGLVESTASASGEAIHRALLPGLLSRVGMWHPEQRVYLGARQTRFQLHPSSGLAKSGLAKNAARPPKAGPREHETSGAQKPKAGGPPPWIVAAELVETSQLFARNAARIDPAWLEAAGGALCRRHYGDPHWAERPAQVTAAENITLFGLTIVKDRRVNFGPIDPKASRRIFILHALVRQEYASKAPFVAHNAAVFEQVRRLRDRARRSDMLADDEAVATFFEARVPDDVHSGKTFEDWRKRREAEDPRALFLSLADVLQGEAEDLSPERFPDVLELPFAPGVRLPLEYRFEHGADDDGITVTVPLALLPALDPGELEWTIPGWHAEKIALLLHALPKATRKALGPVADVARLVAEGVRPFDGAMLPALSRAVLDLTGVRVPLAAWDLHDLPPHLRLRFRVVDAGRVVGEGRDLAELATRLHALARDAFRALPRQRWEREGLTAWSFDALPERAVIEVGDERVLAFPALCDAEGSVAVRAMPSHAAAIDATRGGLRALALIAMKTTLARLEQQVPAAVAASALGDAVGPAPRRQLALRALDDALELADPASFPRTRAAFEKRLDASRARLPAELAALGRIAVEIAGELDRVHATLRALDGKPGAPRAAIADVRSQLAHLVPRGFFAHAAKDRLAHLPRYLRGAQMRLERLPNGPQKDQAKAAQVVPFWTDWLAQHESLRARGVSPEELSAFRWLIEELRVSVFAPELRAVVSVSPQRLADQWAALRG
jgi:ATP-dependent helicase HrpA